MRFLVTAMKVPTKEDIKNVLLTNIVLKIVIVTEMDMYQYVQIFQTESLLVQIEYKEIATNHLMNPLMDIAKLMKSN
jgi:hypothetical protein